jgi:hypothetical protein
MKWSGFLAPTPPVRPRASSAAPYGTSNIFEKSTGPRQQQNRNDLKACAVRGYDSQSFHDHDTASFDPLSGCSNALRRRRSMWQADAYVRPSTLYNIQSPHAVSLFTGHERRSGGCREACPWA